jgi:hypothetical protein
MKQSHAFTLLHVVTSLSLVTILGLTVFYTVNQIQLHMLRQKIYCYQTIRDTLMLDVLKRDLQSMSCYPQFLKKSDNSYKIISLSGNGLPQTADIAWQPTIGGFNRIKGRYDSTGDQWIKKRTTFFESTIQQLGLQPIIEEGIVKAVDLQVHFRRRKIQASRIPLLNQIREL